MTGKAARLAVLGAEPAFSAPVHIGTPNIGDRESLHGRIDEALDRRWLTNNGVLVQELEARLAEFVGVRHCIAVCNGTVALEIIAAALELTGEVIVPAFTFIATPHALAWRDIRPVFVNIDPRTHCIDPDRIEAAITPETSGILGVHVWGRPCDTEAIARIADERGLRVFYDAAHAFGCGRDGRMVGGLGEAEAFSFHATKFFNTAEGGAVATDDDDIARRCRELRNFGFATHEEVVAVGVNGKMSEMSAAVGLTNLDAIEGFIEANRRNYLCYRSSLETQPGLSVVEYDQTQAQNYQYVVLEIDEAGFGLSRDELLGVLKAENVLAKRYFHPGCHRAEPYRSWPASVSQPLVHTDELVGRVLQLPTGTAVSRDDVEVVCRIVREASDSAEAVRERLRSEGTQQR